MIEFIKDLFSFFKERKKWWLFPVIFSLIIIGLLIVVGQGSALAPFFYTLF
ncbi:MAG: hypothetical protein ACI959_001747 [Limisphaerales bacterium]|jgi:hypothetical protein